VIERADLGDGLIHFRIRVAPEKRHRLELLAGADRVRLAAE
jgi:hypothetical protein